MKKILLGLFALVAFSTVNAQLSGYYTQGFEGAAFPPAGWTVYNVNGPTYTWARSTAQAHNSSASAFIRYDATAGGGLDWMVTPRFHVSASTDSLTFWMRLAYSGYPPDSLCIKVSTTDSLLTSFPAWSLLGLSQGVNYPNNSTTWYKYGISLSAYVGQDIFLAFKHFNNDGDGLYIDDVKLGTQPTAEVLSYSINTPANAGSGSPLTPTGTVVNNGAAAQSFNVTMEINPGGYTSTQAVSSLAAGASTNVSFTPWTPATSGVYTLKMYTQLAGDENTQNDTITQTITILQGFPNFGWSASTPLPGGRWAGGTAFTKACISNTDTGYVYYVAGADAAFANASVCYRQNLTTNAFQTIASIPVTKTQVHALAANNKIYVPGGYTGSFSPNGSLQIYDPATNTWTTGAAMPTAVGDYGAAVYHDTLIYVVGGYNGTGDVNTVQIYNVNTNTWTTGTPKTTPAVGGGRMGISGNKIIFVGGYSQTLAATLDDAAMGVIDPMDPTLITWTAIADIPYGTTGRLAGGTSVKDDGRVYFVAGDPNGQGTSVVSKIAAYNTLTSGWELGPDKITGVSNVCNFTSMIQNDSIYLVVMGGYNGVNVVTSNERINLGPIDTLYTSAGVESCGADSVQLSAYNGSAYAWTPAAYFADSTLASQTIYVTSTDTFTVTISQKYGCPVMKDIVATINPIPAVDNFDITQPLCNGSSNGSAEVNMVGSTANYGYMWSNGDMDTVAQNIPAGTYVVTVTDTVTGCFVTDTTQVSEPTALSVTSANGVANGCVGTLTANATGGTVGYGYSWSTTPAQTTQTATALCAGTYTVTVTDANGCTATATASITDISGITANENAGISVYPNPFAEQFTIELTAPEQDAEIEIASMDGKIVYTQLVHLVGGKQVITVNITGLATGVYQLMIKNSQGMIGKQRLIKK